VGCCGHKLSNIEKFKNLTSTLIKAAAHYAKTGEVYAPADLQQGRLKLCNVCKYNNKMNCEKCGCVLAQKVTLVVSNCPIGKW